jgi:hypothetical protein
MVAMLCGVWSRCASSRYLFLCIILTSISLTRAPLDFNHVHTLMHRFPRTELHNLKVRMHPTLLQPISELRNENLRLLNTPPHHLGQQEQPPALRALRAVQEIPSPDLLHPWIRRPAIDRHLVHVLHHIHKPHILRIRTQIPDLVETLSEPSTRLVENITPLRQNVVWRQRAIVALELDAHFDLVQIAAGRQVVVDLAVQRGPVSDGTVQRADVDEVEAEGEGPGRCYVVDFEFAVWRREGGLDGGEVYADDFGARVFWGVCQMQVVGVVVRDLKYRLPCPCTRFLCRSRDRGYAVGFGWVRDAACCREASGTCDGQCRAGRSGLRHLGPSTRLHGTCGIFDHFRSDVSR